MTTANVQLQTQDISPQYLRYNSTNTTVSSTKCSCISSVFCGPKWPWVFDSLLLSHYSRGRGPFWL